jgi:hypothetical protein
MAVDGVLREPIFARIPATREKYRETYDVGLVIPGRELLYGHESKGVHALWP